MVVGGAATAGPYLTRSRYIPAGVGSSTGDVANVLVSAEMLWRLMAVRCHWPYQATAATPLWLLWDMLRSFIEEAEGR